MSRVADQDAAPIGANSDFNRHWAAHAVSAFGDQVSGLALPLIAATTLNASATEVGLLTAAVWTPNLLSLLVGTWADRQSRPRTVLVGANLAQASAVMAVPLAWVFGALTLPVLYAAALALGTGGVVYNTCYPRFFARLVPRRHYVTANSRLSTTASVAAIAGPATAGAVIQALSAPVAMVVDAVSFVVSAALIRTVPAGTPTPVEPGQLSQRFWGRLRSGLTYLFGHPLLRASLVCATLMNFAAFVVQALLVLYATRELYLSAGQIGLALALGAGGALVGAMSAGPVCRKIGAGRSIAAGAALYCVPFAALPLAAPGVRGIVVIALVETVSAFGVMLFDIANNSVKVAVTHEHMRSRVAGGYSTVNYGIRPLGAVCGGLLADHLGIRPTLLMAGVVGLIAVGSVVLSPLGKLGAIDHLAPPNLQLASCSHACGPRAAKRHRRE